ncbi:MAG: hypothetical protein GY872_17580 [Roseibacillus sp.]|jgi:hypothetical protein|nr:hypothetical protein [Roseibacillus sp.]HJM64826.1 hypothetical protein [Roseibacillus sp.]|tara:strand:- start:2871 stop:3689 length:819 start_codon:yes stop_codon:yes gene_type:complete
MKRNVFIKPAVLAGSALFAGFAFAGDPAPKAAIAPPPSDIEVNIGVGYTTEYVYRGINWGDDLFEASIDVSGDGVLAGCDLNWSAGLWLGTWSGTKMYAADQSPGQTVATAFRAATTGNEMRIYGQVSKSVGNFDLALGVLNRSFYGWGGGAPDADRLEPYVGLSTELAGFSLGASAHFDESDTNIYDDLFWQVTAGKGFAVSGNATLSVTGFYAAYEGGAADGAAVYGVAAGLDIAVSDSVTVTPHVTATLGDTSTDDDEITAGVKLNFGF